MTRGELEGNAVRQARFPKNTGRLRVRGCSIIYLSWLRDALPISHTPHRLPRALAHIHLPVYNSSAAGIDPSSEQPPPPDLLDGAEEESQWLEAGAVRGQPCRGVGVVR